MPDTPTNASPPRRRAGRFAVVVAASILGPSAGGEASAGPSSVGDFAAAAARIDRSSVGLVVEDRDGRREWGAGFALRRGGIVVTAAHVVRTARRVGARLPDGRVVAAEVVGADDLSDVAVLRLPLDLPPVAVAPLPRRGAPVVAVGDPLGFSATLTAGHVSHPARPWGATNPYDMVQHDAALNPGSSGGALADRAGRVVGMNVAIADGSRRNVGIGLAVPIAVVARIADRLAHDGDLQRPALRMRLRDNATLRAAIPALTGPGAMIESVEPDAPAAAAGLAAGQIVVAAEGRPVRDVRDLAVALEPKRPGDRFRIVVMVGDDARAIDFVLGGVTPLPAPASAEADEPLGLDLDAGAPPRIRSVAAGSAAEGAGLATGDEILSIGLGRADADRLDRSLGSGAGADGVALLVRRGERTRWVILGRHGRLDGEAPFGSNAEATGSHAL